MNFNILFSITQMLNVFAINTAWANITGAIGDMFLGNSTQGVEGIFGGMGGSAIGEIILGLMILMFFLFLTIVYGMGMVVGSAVLIPSLFAVFQFIPPLRIIVAIVLGIVLGLGLHRFVKR